MAKIRNVNGYHVLCISLGKPGESPNIEKFMAEHPGSGEARRALEELLSTEEPSERHSKMDELLNMMRRQNDQLRNLNRMLKTGEIVQRAVRKTEEEIEEKEAEGTKNAFSFFIE